VRQAGTVGMIDEGAGGNGSTVRDTRATVVSGRARQAFVGDGSRTWQVAGAARPMSRETHPPANQHHQRVG